MRTTTNILTSQPTLAVGVTDQVTGILGSYPGMFDCSKALGESPIHRSTELARNWKRPRKQET